LYQYRSPSRIVSGGQVALLVAALGVSGALAAGTLIGLACGYLRGASNLSPTSGDWRELLAYAIGNQRAKTSERILSRDELAALIIEKGGVL
jgi:hypothetical protein